MKLYALFIWINDTPITGTVLSLTNIVEPRIELTQYKVGDLVSVRFSRFGTPKGIIGKIGDENMKKDLQAIIDDHASFMDIIQQTCPGSMPPSLGEQAQKQLEGREINLDPQIEHTEKELEEIGNKDEVKRVEDLNGKTKGIKKTKPVTEKQAKINLEKAADAQRLFDMEGLEENADDSGKTCKDNAETANIVGSAFTVLNSNSGTQADDKTSQDVTSLHTKIRHVEGKVNWLEMQLSQAWSYIYELQRNVQWLSQPCNQNQPSTSGVVSDQSHYPAVTSPANDHVDGDFDSSVKGTQGIEQNSDMSGESEDALYNSYTKDQLYGYVKYSEDFTKASKLLFRKLYTAEEYKGRSLTGNRANKNMPARPALEDQRKLKVIHELIQRRWPYIRPSMVNVKLSELLKPSRN